jgi:hypothetical protein
MYRPFVISKAASVSDLLAPSWCHRKSVQFGVSKSYVQICTLWAAVADQLLPCCIGSAWHWMLWHLRVLQMVEKDIGFVGEVTRVNPTILKVRHHLQSVGYGLRSHELKGLMHDALPP